jgi:hypothetical protein
LESTPVEDQKLQNMDQKVRQDSSAANISSKAREIFFETKSLAEVYAQQGYISKALEIYRVIKQRNPSDKQVVNCIAELEACLGSRKNTRIKTDTQKKEDSTK